MPEAGGKKNQRVWRRRVINLAIAAVVTWALYRSIGFDLSELSRTELARWRPAPLALSGSALLLIAVYLLHSLLWRRIASDLIGERIPIPTALRIYFLANLGRYLPGRVWQVAGMAVLARRAGISAVGAIAASALAQLNFLLTGALFLTLLMPLLLGIGPAIAAATILIALIGAIIWSNRTESGREMRRRLGGRFGGKVATILGAIGEVRPVDAMIWSLGYALSWVLLGAAFATFTISFVPEAAVEFRYLAATMAAGYLSGYLAIFAPAGVGVREGVLGLLLTTVIPPPAAVVVSIASRIWFTITEVIVLIAIPLLRRPDGPETMSNAESDLLRGAL